MPARSACTARPASSATAPCITRSSSARTTTTRTRWCSCYEPPRPPDDLAAETSPPASPATTRTRCRWRMRSAFIARPRAARRGGREAGPAQRARPRAGARHRLADQRAGARQLGDGRLCAARRANSPADAPTRLAWSAPCSPAAPRRRRAAPGQCVRIMTGGVMPAGLDTVVPQEFVRVERRRRDRHRRRASLAARRQPPLRRRRPDEGAAGAARRPHPAPGRPGPARIARHGRGAGVAAPARRLLLDRRRAALDRRAARRGCVYDSNRYTLLRHAAAAGLRHHRHGRRARRTGRARSRVAQAARTPTPSSPRAASASARPTTPSTIMAELGDVLFWKIAHAPGPPDGLRAHRLRTATAPSCSACPAIRWR